MTAGRRRRDANLTRAKPSVPTRDQLEAARGKRVADVIAPGLRVLFCGINPGLYSGAVGHHFARPGNRFWKALHRAGFSHRLLSPFDERSLLGRGYGITNLVNRATASADELDAEELRRGARRLARTAHRYRPRIIAILGLGAYRTAFGVARVSVGPRDEPLGGAHVWVLPNPSGRTAGYQLDALVGAFRALRNAAGSRSRASSRPPRARARARRSARSSRRRDA